MHGDDRPTKAGVEAMKACASLGSFGPLDDERVHRTYGDGRVFLPGPASEAAREMEESVRAREQRHAEGRARIMRAIGGTLGLSHATGHGPWASSMGPFPPPGVEDLGENPTEDPGKDGGGGAG